MASRKYPVDAVNWPVTDVAVEAAIGRVVIAWSVLDREIDDALRLILRCSPNVGLCVTANLGAQTKLDIILATVHTLFHVSKDEVEGEGSESYRRSMKAYADIENAFVANLEELVAETRTKAIEFRNWLAHGQPYLLQPHENCEHLGHWIWAKSSARKGGVKLRLQRLMPEPFDSAAKDIRELVERWHGLLERLPKRLEVLDAADAAWHGDD